MTHSTRYAILVHLTASTLLIATCAVIATRAVIAVPKAGPAPTSTRPAALSSESTKTVSNADTLAAFDARIKDYLAVHRKLESALPRLPNEATPQQIDTNQRSLGDQIKAARRDARQGEFFTPDMLAYVKSVLDRIFAGPDGKILKSSIMDENPGIPKLEVNVRYPDDVPLSTMPPEVLSALPKLEEDLEYRFVGDRLVLLDGHAHMILDFTDDVLPN